MAAPTPRAPAPCSTSTRSQFPPTRSRAIAFAIAQPADGDINEIVLRPTVQEF